VRSAANTPEELESLFEDALILGDRDAVLGLFDQHAALVAEPGGVEARGAKHIARHASSIRDRGWRYLADPRRIVQASDTTLVVAEQAINVMRRGADGGWRYAIALINTENTIEGNDND
jgi:hypothetical protein